MGMGGGGAPFFSPIEPSSLDLLCRRFDDNFLLSALSNEAAALVPSAALRRASILLHRAAAVSPPSSSMEMKYSVAVVGGGPSGACAAEVFAKDKSIDTYIIERKMNNAKPCGGAIPVSIR